ncbi:MAG: hypothetical protein NTX49_09800 [Chlamydiae bacterium]|nr:hypothetical protein [Chlamydiota bacterium]
MVSAVTNQTISFTAKWDASNSSLQDTVGCKINKICLYFLHRFAMGKVLPATRILQERVERSKITFADNQLVNRFQRKPIEITTPDGVKLRGTFLQSSGCDASAPVVIFAQPNPMLHTEGAFYNILSDALDKGKQCNFILFDYRECGESDGTAIMAKDLIVDGESIYQFARDELNVEPKDIHMMGWSFGGGVTAGVKAMHPECTGNYVNDRSFTGILETVYELLGKGFLAKIACVVLRFLGWEALNAGKALESLQGNALITYHPNDYLIRGAAQLRKSPYAIQPNIHILELQGQESDGIQNYHAHPLAIITQNNGRRAIEEVGEMLFSGIPTSQEQDLPGREFSSATREPTVGSSEGDEDSSEWDTLLEVRV